MYTHVKSTTRPTGHATSRRIEVPWKTVFVTPRVNMTTRNDKMRPRETVRATDRHGILGSERAYVRRRLSTFYRQRRGNGRGNMCRRLSARVALKLLFIGLPREMSVARCRCNKSTSEQ